MLIIIDANCRNYVESKYFFTIKWIIGYRITRWVAPLFFENATSCFLKLFCQTYQRKNWVWTLKYKILLCIILPGYLKQYLHPVTWIHAPKPIAELSTVQSAVQLHATYYENMCTSYSNGTIKLAINRMICRVKTWELNERQHDILIGRPLKLLFCRGRCQSAPPCDG